MGTSTDAVLAYGVDFDEDLSNFDKLFTKHGMGGTGHNSFDWDKLLSEIAGRDVSWDEEEKHPVQHEIHCSFSHPLHIFYVKGHQFKAYRGHPQHIKDLPVDLVSVEKFKAWFKKHEIQIPEPKWLLFSFWET